MKSIPLFVGDETGLHDVLSVPDARTLRVASPTNPLFGHKVRSRRINLGITQGVLAELVGIHQVTMSRLENGVIPLTDNMRERIESVLKDLESR